VLWEAYADKALVAPRLQELYVERDAIKLVLAVLRPQVDLQAGQALALKRHQKLDTLNAQLTTVERQIVAIEHAAQRRGTPRAAPITTVEPVSPPSGEVAVAAGPNANDPRYTGSPYGPSHGGY
jgi:hypothetical protein